MIRSLLSCMIASAQFYGLPPRVLPSIQQVEGGSPGLVHHNTDHSADLGIMQINTSWVAPIAALTGLPAENVTARLLNQPCFNIAAAALILRRALVEEHGDLMRAIGDYHSHTAPLNLGYQRKVRNAASRLFGG